MPTERYFINADTKTYWGSVVGADGEDAVNHAVQKEGLEEVPFPPNTSASQTWNGTGWNAYTAPVPLTEQLDALFLTLKPAEQIQYFPYFGGIYALIEQGNLAQAKAILSAIPTTGDAVAIQQQMVAVFP